MTDAAVDAAEIPKQISSTAGMTTKVVKGSIWTLAGSVLPMAVSFVATPFVIRFLGSEAYGVLLLVGLIPTYFSFADFGMGIASTKFAAEAYGRKDDKLEAEFVWTAAAIAAFSAAIIAVPIFVFSFQIVRLLNVPDHLLSTASTSLKIASGSFFVGILSSVLNSPMLARLRMDLNTLTQAVPRVLLTATTPLVLYYGLGIVGAVSWAFVVAVATIVTVILCSGYLLPIFLRPTYNLSLVRSLVRFGGGLIISGIAAILLVNIEKLALTRMVSVRALAYYSVAFLLANMANMFAQAMVQSLIPAFSQLVAPEKKEELSELFERGNRLNLILLLPALTILTVTAMPFLTVWAGVEFGRESSVPFYLLAFGLFFNILAFVPYTSILAFGRTDVLAKVYWIELAFYLIAVFALVKYFGIVGAAAAWSLRVILDAFVIIPSSKRLTGLSLEIKIGRKQMAIAILLLLPPIAFAAFYDSFSFWLLLIVPLFTFSYIAFAWRNFLRIEEREKVSSRLRVLYNTILLHERN